MKTGAFSIADLGGLGEFVRRHPEFRPLVVCVDETRPVAERAGFEATLWTDFLLRGPPRAPKGARTASVPSSSGPSS